MLPYVTFCSQDVLRILYIELFLKPDNLKNLLDVGKKLKCIKWLQNDLDFSFRKLAWITLLKKKTFLVLYYIKS